MRAFCFTVDDNIRFFKELSQGDGHSLFSHPYLAMYRRLHERFDLRVQLNLFYEMPGFNLSGMTERFKDEWAANADWLKLSFHSRLENVNPYLNAGYWEVYEDCAAVHREILRFAGEKSLAKTTTIHYCQTTLQGLCALRDLGVKGLLGLFGSQERPSSSYSLLPEDCACLRRGEKVQREGMDFYSIDAVMNGYGREALLRRMGELLDRERLCVMIHEQYFYPDYPAYQPDFEQKITRVFELLRENGFESRFVEEIGT